MNKNQFEGQKISQRQTKDGWFVTLKIDSNHTPHNLILDDVGTTYDFEFTNNQEDGEYHHVTEILANDIPSVQIPTTGEGGGGDINTATSGYNAPTAEFKLERVCADNPELPRGFVKELLEVMEDDIPGVPYEFGPISPDWRV